MTRPLPCNIMKMYIYLIFAFVFINTSSCDVTGNEKKNSGSKTNNGQQLKLPNLKDCKDSKYFTRNFSVNL